MKEELIPPFPKEYENLGIKKEDWRNIHRLMQSYCHEIYQKGWEEIWRREEEDDWAQWFEKKPSDPDYGTIGGNF